jgi:acylphosphatase
MAAARLRVHITGRVQMVGFRAFTQDEAARLGIVGWVRNTPDGAVAVVAEGERTALEEFLAALRRGPHGARVDDVTASWSPPENEFDDFYLRY